MRITPLKWYAAQMAHFYKMFGIYPFFVLKT